MSQQTDFYLQICILEKNTKQNNFVISTVETLTHKRTPSGNRKSVCHCPELTTNVKDSREQRVV